MVTNEITGTSFEATTHLIAIPHVPPWSQSQVLSLTESQGVDIWVTPENGSESGQ